MKIKITIIIGIIQVFVALGAIPAGLSMITQPDGSGLLMNVSLLQNGPFHDFLIPGLFLFIFNGLFNLGAAFLSFFRSPYAVVIALCLGLILSLWVSIQVYVTGLISFMQPMFFLIGLAEVVLAILIIKKNK
jgi:hypothetical protein